MEVVPSCPANFQNWQKKAQKCDNTDQYHCLYNEFSQTVSGCIDPIWVEEGYCPLYNSKALKLDTEKCQGGCPNAVYRSFDVYKYSGCYSSQQPGSSSTAVNNITDIPDPLPPGGSTFNVAAVVVPVLFIIIIIAVVVAVFIYRRQKGYHSVPRNAGHVENAPLNDGTDKNIGIQQTECQDEIQEKESEGFNYAKWLRHVNFNIKNIAEDTDLVSGLVRLLRENNTLALIGEWGSGRRTLAIQIAKEFEKKEKENVDIRVLSEFHDRNSDFPISLQSTILLIPDLCRLCDTEQRATRILNYLRNICSSARISKTYIIATFRKTAYDSFTLKMIESFRNLFLHRQLIKLSKHTLSEIVKKYHSDLPEKLLDAISQAKSDIGSPLTTILCIRNCAYRNGQFLDDPLPFIISKLEVMRNSEDKYSRLTFRVLVYIMLQGGTVEKSRLGDCSEHRVFAMKEKFTKKSKDIQDCVTQLLNSYLEETVDGTSYRILHDVITKCTFLVAMKMDYGLVFRKCETSLLVDCIRNKSKMERVTSWGKVSWDTSELTVGIPSESYPNIARALKQRKDIMENTFKDVKWFENINFQKVWNDIKLA